MTLFHIPGKDELSAQEIAAALRLVADSIEMRHMLCTNLRHEWYADKAWNHGRLALELSRVNRARAPTLRRPMVEGDL